MVREYYWSVDFLSKLISAKRSRTLPGEEKMGVEEKMGAEEKGRPSVSKVAMEGPSTSAEVEIEMSDISMADDQLVGV